MRRKNIKLVQKMIDESIDQLKRSPTPRNRTEEIKHKLEAAFDRQKESLINGLKEKMLLDDTREISLFYAL